MEETVDKPQCPTCFDDGRVMTGEIAGQPIYGPCPNPIHQTLRCRPKCLYCHCTDALHAGPHHRAPEAPYQVGVDVGWEPSNGRGQAGPMPCKTCNGGQSKSPFMPCPECHGTGITPPTSFAAEVETALSEFLSLHITRSEYLAAITAAHERAMEVFANRLKQRLVVRWGNQPEELALNEVYDDIDAEQRSRIKGEPIDRKV